MCAIAGLVGDCDPARVRRMCDVLAHRGPDGEGAVQATLAEHAAGEDHSRKLWALIQFELWARARVASESVGAHG